MRDAGHRTPDAGHRTAKKAKIIYPPPRGVDIMSGLDWYDVVVCTNVGINIEGLVLIRLTGKVLFSN